MSRNNTGNPIGSGRFPDFEDNVKNLDEAVNTADPQWVDRFGRFRLPLMEQERQFVDAQDRREGEFQDDQADRESEFRTFIASSGYQFAGDYAAGIEITQYNQLIRDSNGEFWRVSGQVDLPYVTTGAGLPEDDVFVPAGDAVLRQDLANPDKGAAMVAFVGPSGEAHSLADLANPDIGTALVGFRQAGEGATAWELSKKLQGVEVNLLDFIPPSERAAILDYTSTLDATPYLQNAINQHHRIALPEGLINIKSSWVTLRSGTQLVGRGIGKTIVRGTYLFGARGMFYADSGSANVEDNLQGIYVGYMTLDGAVQELGNQSFTHLLSISGATNPYIEQVEFLGFRGDGCYLASSPFGGQERHNVNATFRDCIFDGVTATNRNGLSVIDCDGLLVDNCLFKNIGNPDLSKSVGAIDFEPNGDWSVYRNIKIKNCTFLDISSVNTAGITFFNGRQIAENIKDWVVDSCVFERNYRSIAGSGQSKDRGSVLDGLKITNCRFYNSIAEDITASSFSGVILSNNVFEVFPTGDMRYRGGIRVGDLSSSRSNMAVNYIIANNIFRGQRPQFGCISIRSASGLFCSGNSFENTTGACISIYSNPNNWARTLEGLVFTGNSASCDMDTFGPTSSCPTTGLFVNTAGVTTEFISSTCIERDNVVYGRVPKHRNVSLVTFREQEVSVAPTNGTWLVGNRVYKAVPAAGSTAFVCTKQGTFGTMVGVSGNTETGTYVISGITDPENRLREGHIITVGGDTKTYRIAKKDDSNVYLSTSYTGTAGAGLAINFSAPEFITV